LKARFLFKLPGRRLLEALPVINEPTRQGVSVGWVGTLDQEHIPRAFDDDVYARDRFSWAGRFMLPCGDGARGFWGCHGIYWLSFLGWLNCYLLS